MTLHELAQQILRDAGCDEYTYGGAESENIMKDLMSVFEPGDLAPYTYIDVANEILSFSHPRPIERKPFRVLYDIPAMCDAFGCDSLESAKSTVLDMYHEWMDEEKIHWEGADPNPHEKDNWNDMICNFTALVQKYDPDTDEYEDYWFPPEEDLEAIGWDYMEVEE